MKTLILGAHAVSEHADGPAWARVELTEEFLQKVERLSALCSEHKLRSVTVHVAPVEWDLQDELNLTRDRLEVHGDSLWFSCSPKHGTYECESKVIGLEDIKAILTGQLGGGHEDQPTNYDFVFEGDFIFQNEDVKELYEEHLANLNQEPADE